MVKPAKPRSLDHHGEGGLGELKGVGVGTNCVKLQGGHGSEPILTSAQGKHPYYDPPYLSGVSR